MSIIIDKNKRVMVQGITGREGQARSKLMIDYGTNVLCGSTPGRGGTTIYDLPVYDSCAQAVRAHGTIDISVIFVPAPLVKEAAIEALYAGIKFLVLVPDRVPIFDILEIDRICKKNNAQFLGPNTLGVLSPGRGVLGMIGGRAENARNWFLEGRVGVASRSGGITSSIAYYLSREGIGESTIVHVGGDPILGLPLPEILKMFESDPETDVVVIFGEIGTSQEEMCAEMIMCREFTKPLVAFIGGKAAKSGTRFSHAGAIIEGNRGTHEGKVRKLKEAGAKVVERFDDIPKVVKSLCKS